MCEPSEEDKNNPPKAKELLMDLDDLDFSGSWPLDQIPLASNPMMMSPLVISSSEQPCSPLWAFSDSAGAAAFAGVSDDEKLSCASAGAPSFRLAEYPLFLTYAGTSNTGAESTTENDNTTHLPSPLMGLMPLDGTESYWVIKERMTQALRNFKESTEQHVLAQVWAPIKKGNRYVLTTSGQPFVLDPHSNGLNQYRTVSLMYMFSVDGESDIELGLPGRVFRQKLPEWTPNVQYYSSREFSRLDHALHYNVRGTLALPVFGPSGQSCVGVVELIMTSEKIHYAPEVDKVCKALQAVNLKSSEILDHQTNQICNLSRQNALAEILVILTVVCETHKLPLAQTWVPCMHRSVLAYGGGLKKSCTSFDGSCMGRICMSTTDAASYVVDAQVWGFREACLEHHLQKAQGVAGRAFLNRSSCFCRDVTQFCKTEYPLVHYARMFKLTSCFAICLQSSHTGDDDYILEFFLPPTITDKSEQDSLLGCLLATMKQHFQSFRVASGIEIGENQVSVEIIEASADKKIDLRTESVQIPFSVKLPPRPNPSPNKGQLLLPSPNQQVKLNPDPVNNKGIVSGNNVGECHAPAALTEVKEMKRPERKRGKAEKTISLDVLQQYFSGSLKDAAKSLGVCPTTMKRICRQHGILRWPSRKINKVNRSLTKLQRVIESVQGTDGALDLTTLTSSPLPVSVGAISWPPNPNVGHQACSPTGSKPPEPLAGANEHLQGERFLSQEHNVHQQNGLVELSNPSKRSKTASGTREESAGTPTSHASCEGSPVNETKVPVHERCFTIGGSPELPFQPGKEPDFPPAFSVPNPLLPAELQEHFGGMLVEDAGSSKDLRELCPSTADEKFPESNWINTNPVCENDAIRVPPKDAMATTQPRFRMTSMTIKATYREDIIRFRISMNSGISELKDEVAKRLKLEEGTFDIKYLDDDHEWVLIACDADLQECLDISRSSGGNMARLSVHDVMTNLGSSCESTGNL